MMLLPGRRDFPVAELDLLVLRPDALDGDAFESDSSDVAGEAPSDM